jgi:hypothetical protein
MQISLRLWPRQFQAFRTRATELLFGGATEGGKSHFIRVFLIAACLAVPGLQCVLIRKKYDDILKNHVEGPTGFKTLLGPLIKRGRVKVTEDSVRFHHKIKDESGELIDTWSVIAFQHCQDERQFDSAQGVEKHVLVVDEATQISERLIRFFRGWVRMPNEMRRTLSPEWRDKLPCIIYTANPIGVSVGFFRRNFVRARKPFDIEEVEGFLRQYIPSRAQDNPSVDMKAHHGRLAGIGDAALAKALDEGDWDTPTGEFFPEWDEARHVLPDFSPPRHWYRFRTYDHGTAEPFCCYWWAVSDGEPFECREWERFPRRFHLQIPTPEGFKPHVFLPSGALIAYREWYGADPVDPSKGLRMRNEDIADGVLDRSNASEEAQLMTLTDSWPFRDEGGESIAMTFASRGWVLQRGDTSRATGWSQMRSRLIGVFLRDATERFPMIYFVESCRAARDYVPALPRHPSEGKKEDAAEHGEATHACDAIRLAAMAHKVVKRRETPSQALIAQAASQKVTLRDIARGRGGDI